VLDPVMVATSGAKLISDNAIDALRRDLIPLALVVTPNLPEAAVLTGASMAELKVNELAQGTGMFNLTRQLGGSLGIAIMATMLSRFTAQKKALLTEHVTTMDPVALGRLDQLTHGLISRGVNPIAAKTQALMVLDNQIRAQASVLAFSRIYILSGIILLASLPLLFLFKTGKGRGSAGMAH